MSVIDEIVKEIVAICKRDKRTDFSYEVLREDYVKGFAAEFAEEIAERLKANGISVDP